MPRCLERNVPPFDPVDPVLSSRAGSLSLTLEIDKFFIRRVTGEPSKALEMPTALDAEDQNHGKTGLK